MRLDVRNLLPNAAFTRTNRMHSFKQFAEVVFAKHRRSLFQPLIVHSEALLYILIENLCSPLAETCGFQRRHAIAYGDDCIKRIEVDKFVNLATIPPFTTVSILEIVVSGLSSPSGYKSPKKFSIFLVALFFLCCLWRNLTLK